MERTCKRIWIHTGYFSVSCDGAEQGFKDTDLILKLSRSGSHQSCSHWPFRRRLQMPYLGLLFIWPSDTLCQSLPTREHLQWAVGWLLLSRRHAFQKISHLAYWVGKIWVFNHGFLMRFLFWCYCREIFIHGGMGSFLSIWQQTHSRKKANREVCIVFKFTHAHNIQSIGESWTIYTLTYLAR